MRMELRPSPKCRVDEREKLVDPLRTPPFREDRTSLLPPWPCRPSSRRFRGCGQTLALRRPSTPIQFQSRASIRYQQDIPRDRLHPRLAPFAGPPLDPPWKSTQTSRRQHRNKHGPPLRCYACGLQSAAPWSCSVLCGRSRAPRSLATRAIPATDLASPCPEGTRLRRRRLPCRAWPYLVHDSNPHRSLP